MKVKRITIKILLAIFTIGTILGSFVTVKATAGAVNFKASTNSVKVGDTFTIIMSAECEEGISGAEGKFSFDSSKLELVSKGVISEKWSFLGDENLITVLSNTRETIKNADLYKLEFKVKSGVSVGEKLEVNFSEIKLTKDVEPINDVQGVETTQKVTVTVVATPTATPTPTPSTNTSENTNGSKAANNASNSNSGKTVVVYSPDDENTTTKKTATKTNTSKSGLPYTGLDSFIVLGIIIVGISSIALYFINRKYRKYNV